MDLPGIDLPAGLRSAHENPTTYTRLLRQFMTGHVDDVLSFRDAWRSGDSAEAVRRIHTLKGVAATLGMPLVRARAFALEKALRAGEPDDVVLPLAEPLEAALSTIISSLRTALPPERVGGVEPMDAEAFQAGAHQLLLLLEQDDLGSIALFRDLAATLVAALHESTMARLRRQVDRFELPAAARTLRAAIAAGR